MAIKQQIAVNIKRVLYSKDETNIPPKMPDSNIPISKHDSYVLIAMPIFFSGKLFIAGNANKGYTIDKPNPAKNEPIIDIRGVKENEINISPILSISNEIVVAFIPILSAYLPNITLDKTYPIPNKDRAKGP